MHLALTVLAAAFALACVASSARAEPWGQEKAFRLTDAEPIFETFLSPKFAAGSDGSYYLLTEDVESEEFVLERFDEGEQQASIHFNKRTEEGEGFGSEGVNAALAVDPSRDRAYVMLVYERRAQNRLERKEENKTGKPVFPLDAEMPAAGALYAFEYKPESKELVSSKKNAEGPLPQLTREDLKGQGENPKEALLDPRGIAVEPETGDLAISGNEDEESDKKVESEEAQKQCRAAVQFVTVKTKTGSKEIEGLSLGARYVDSAGKVLFERTGCGEETEEDAINQAPASPVFAPDGTLLGYGEDETVEEYEPEGIIWQLTPADADNHAPGEVTMTPKELFVAGSVPTFHPAVGEAEQPDSVMSLVPEGSTDGTIYVSGYHWGGDAPAGQPTVLVLHYSDSGGGPSISEIGWTAGGSEIENLAPGPCNLHGTEESTERIMIGGLAGPKHGLLAFTYYTEQIGPGHEEQVEQAEVVQFGEGGKTAGCPTVAVTTPTQSYRNAPTNELPAGQPLEVSSLIGTPGNPDTQAASPTSVAWTVKFTPSSGGPPEVSHPETNYEYNGLHAVEPGYGKSVKLDLGPAKAGVYEIVDVVHTDDLADQVAEPEKADVVTVIEPGGLSVKPGLPVPGEVRAHEQEAQLTAEVAEVPEEGKLPEEVHIKKVVWEFGDGTEAKQSNPPETLVSPVSIKHAFGRCGTGVTTRCKITVTVVADTSHGEKTQSGHIEITVKESKAEEAEEAAAKKKAEEEAAAKKKAEEEAAKGGVAGYIASFAGSSLSVSASGATSVRITCPSGGSCSGTLTLQTLDAVASSHGKHAKKKVVTLANGGFSLSGGSKSITLHLNATARALLGRSHGLLRAKLTILSRGTAGRRNSSSTHPVTLRLVKKKSRRH